MADVKWIKIVTDMFNNRKIKQIRRLPEGDAIIIIWLQILCLAGQNNDNGYVYFSRDIPYTDEMLSTEFDRPVNVIRLALATFERFGMIEIIDDILLVSNWEKYQSVEKLEKIREKTRQRVAKHREAQRQLSQECGVTLHVTQCNAIELDKELEVDKEKDKKNMPNGFDAFWNSYPKKIGKGAAEKAWKKLKPNEQLQEVIITAINSQKKTKDWLKDNGQFIPYPSTWLNQKRWEDEYGNQHDGTVSPSTATKQYGINL